MSAQVKMNPQKAKEMQERNRERKLIADEMKKHDSSTVEMIAAAIGMDKSKVLRHLVAMRTFGKVQMVGDRDNQILYSLAKE